MPKNVKVYSTTTCPYCTMAKDYLRQKHVEFQNLDVGQDRNALMEMKQKSGQMGVPVIDIDGRIIVGFDREAIDQELSRASTPV
jgi:glutaredoxin-like YruB-family protein